MHVHSNPCESWCTQVFLTTTHIAIVMEYASGGELFEFVKRSGRLSEDAARFFFQQLISGVDYCHRQVHRCPARTATASCLDTSTAAASCHPYAPNLCNQHEI